MMLNHEIMRSFLSLAFNIPTKYIVPKQGNWFNVQDNGTEGFKVDTWCAYKIKRTRNRTLPYYMSQDDGTLNWSVSNMISTIDVQLVGLHAEYGAQSMTHWTHRADIEAFLTVSGMALMPHNLGDYYVTDFAQDGANTVLAYNATFDVQWLSEITSSQQLLNQVILPSGYLQIMSSGNLTIEI